MNELAEVTRAVATEKNTGLADVAATFHQRGADEAQRAVLFAWDKTHLGDVGHRLASKTVFRAIGQE
jgi:hypothetical protein